MYHRSQGLPRWEREFQYKLTELLRIVVPHEDEKIPAEALRELVDLARMTASTANSQALKFRICSTDEENERVFGTLKWAGALPDWDGPVKGERPSAYLIILCDLALGKNKLQDDGITAQTIMLGAVEMGYGGCMLGNVERKRLAELLDIDTAKYSIDLVLALGKPKEKVVVVPVGADGDVRYYRDAEQVHYVPKRSLDEIIL